MENKFERRLSKVLVILIIILFLLTISQRFVSGWAISLAWYVLFLGSWFMMLVYSFDVLFNKNARGFSILVAIITSLVFLFLSVHGLSALAIFIRALPRKFVINNDFFLKNNQMIFYSSLVIAYFFHMANSIALRDREEEVKIESEKTEEELRQIRDDKLDSIIAEIEKNKEDGLTEDDRKLLNSHILDDGEREEEEFI